MPGHLGLQRGIAADRVGSGSRGLVALGRLFDAPVTSGRVPSKKDF